MINLQDHFGLVGKITKKYIRLQPGQRMDETEEWGDGMVGLVEAGKAFKPELGFQFSTFAYWCIRNSILKGITSRALHQRPSISLDDTFVAAAKKDKGIQQFDAEDLTKTIFQLMDRRTKFVLQRNVMEGVVLREVGEEMGICKERVRQLRNAGLEQARKICERLNCA
jgi:RNA polymerase primary sigma factor/RNA polymerase sigma factor